MNDSQHFVIGPVDEDLIEEFFCPLKEAEKIDLLTMEELMVAKGVFPSKGRARSNGFSGPIPMGVSLVGTRKKRFWVWRHPSTAAEGESEPTAKDWNDWSPIVTQEDSE